MIAFLHWLKSICFGVLNGIAKLAVFVVLLIAVLLLIGLFQGDGLPKTMVLALDLRNTIADSASTNYAFGAAPVTVLDTVLALDSAERDARVKGVFVKIGSGELSLAQAEELGAALKKFRKSGKFVVADAIGFESASLGDYLTAASADQIWMQPRAPFMAAGFAGGEIFLRGLLDKVQANPQIVKRADYKSAADMYMEKEMTPADHEQLTRLMQSWYDNATQGAAADRHIDSKAMVAAFEASPQLSEDVLAKRLIDRIGYDDEAQGAALGRAGDGAKFVAMSRYIGVRKQTAELGTGARIAIIPAAGEIKDGTSSGGGVFGSDSGIAGDDLARAIRQAAADNTVKAIILRVDSPGGSVTASDQILHAVKMAQAGGKPVVVSMGSLAASGGYYISLSANRIVAEPGTITGSIGVLTGKVSFDRTAALAGIGTGLVGVGRGATFNTPFQPYTPDQLAALNHQADVIYADFMQKVAAGRHLPLAQVQDIAKGRVWSGADARTHGLVDQLGGFWTATDIARKLAGIDASTPVVFKMFPHQKNLWEAMSDLFGNSDQSVSAVRAFVTLMNAAPVKAVVETVADLPKGGVELKAANLPR